MLRWTRPCAAEQSSTRIPPRAYLSLLPRQHSTNTARDVLALYGGICGQIAIMAMIAVPSTNVSATPLGCPASSDEVHSVLGMLFLRQEHHDKVRCHCAILPSSRNLLYSVALRCTLF
jgi:hypothetical protein